MSNVSGLKANGLFHHNSNFHNIIPFFIYDMKNFTVIQEPVGFQPAQIEQVNTGQGKHEH